VPSVDPVRELRSVQRAVVHCTACPRLVAWRTDVARTKRAAYADQTYWGKPVTGFGDPAARIVVVGLAPGAHGANRTGRVFTGDRSGDWLYRAMHRAGLANQPTSRHRDDGLELTDAWVTLAVRCVPPDNAPTPAEKTRCLPFLQRELAALRNARVVVCLGAIAYAAIAESFGVTKRPKFGHGVVVHAPNGFSIVCSYHPGQQNTFTGRLTEKMLDDVFRVAVQRATASVSGAGKKPGGAKKPGAGKKPGGAKKLSAPRQARRRPSSSAAERRSSRSSRRNRASDDG
jgi:uracil-DNA glycosylase family 4